MGVHKNVGYDYFPIQGSHKDRQVKVCFNYDTSHGLRGEIVRDDVEDPFLTIIKLSDGRYVLSSECMYSLV